MSARLLLASAAWCAAQQLVVPAAGSAQISVGENVQVSAARGAIAHHETNMAVHPRDANLLIACSMLTGGTAAYVSQDGGRTWSAPVHKTAPRANDPTCAYGPDNVVYVVHKLKEKQGPSDIDRLAIHRSVDGGKTWEPLIRGPQATDRPWIAVDRRPETGRWGRLYAAYNYHVHGEFTELGHAWDGFLNAVALQRSDDGGRTFNTFAMRALMGDSAHPQRNPVMGGAAVLSDGSVLVLYEHSVGGGTNPKTGKMAVLRSSLHVLRSNDGGDSLDPAAKVADIQTSYNEPHTRGVTTALAVDPGSAAFRDRVYVAWGDVRTGRTEIMISHSSDGGRNWSAPVKVSDAPEMQRASGGPDQFMPTVAVNRNGVVGILWYDRRDSPDNLSFYPRFSASLDGGLTWMPSVRLSPAPHAAQGTSGFGVTGGDTAGLAAAADNRFHALWVDTRTGTQQLWTAPITVHGNVTAAR